MKGFIKIEQTTHEGKSGLAVQTELTEVSPMDRLAILHAVCIALNIQADELHLCASLICSGILDKATSVKTLHEESESRQDDWPDLIRMLKEALS